MFCDELVIPSASIPMVAHACRDHAISDGYLAYKHTFDKCVIDFGGRRYITTSKRVALIAALVSDVNHRVVGRSYLQVIYPLIAHINVF